MLSTIAIALLFGLTGGVLFLIVRGWIDDERRDAAERVREAEAGAAELDAELAGRCHAVTWRTSCLGEDGVALESDAPPRGEVPRPGE